MNKPIVLVREEFKQNLADVINKSGLPPFVIEPIMQSYLEEVRIAAQNQLETEKTRYEQYLKAQADKESGGNKNEF